MRSRSYKHGQVSFSLLLQAKDSTLTSPVQMFISLTDIQLGPASWYSLNFITPQSIAQSRSILFTLSFTANVMQFIRISYQPYMHLQTSSEGHRNVDNINSFITSSHKGHNWKSGVPIPWRSPNNLIVTATQQTESNHYRLTSAWDNGSQFCTWYLHSNVFIPTLPQ